MISVVRHSEASLQHITEGNDLKTERNDSHTHTHTHIDRQTGIQTDRHTHVQTHKRKHPVEI